jgi:hypothetical protein
MEMKYIKYKYLINPYPLPKENCGPFETKQNKIYLLFRKIIF